MAIVIVSAGASFFFALAETALFSLGKWQVRQLAERGRRGAVAANLLTDPQSLLATMVLGNTFAMAAMLATALWMALEGHWQPTLTVFGLFALALVGCEVFPKTLAVRSPESWALRAAFPLLVLEKLSTPLRRIAQAA
ncbi:MAG TPA: CNNM domain-containing protein, partial [Verrucomicrobiota bacterium]|nr:CNNM domain-containing protein [Verrucomicrobiota bacterium]